ncbi:hypothetical protein J8N05_26060 [Streptomyces sp. BH-SS-21]|uniref:Uncharacterized protein n=1 Tax=Streptomyces liliiviolaceus TaxID=2823109 RepID=A0A941B5N8_9ACTN|nr:hypothetical protein [Streptomyces liliiviolaceus]MBQ0851635.1 hypothetical protein [Streptomyces liliiviolaceus]
MSSRTSQRARRVTRDAAPCPAPAVLLGVLLAVLVACLGYVPTHGRAAPAAAPVVTVSVPHERLASPTKHDQCCGLPTHEARAVLPVGAHPLPAVAPRMPVVAPAATAARVPALPPVRGAPDLHVLQVQRI